MTPTSSYDCGNIINVIGNQLSLATPTNCFTRIFRRLITKELSGIINGFYCKAILISHRIEELKLVDCPDLVCIFSLIHSGLLDLLGILSEFTYFDSPYYNLVQTSSYVELTLHMTQTSPQILGHLECLHTCLQGLSQGGHTSRHGSSQLQNLSNLIAIKYILCIQNELEESKIHRHILDGRLE